jgi:branched-chain amino acid transport system substrate-binding protein
LLVPVARSAEPITVGNLVDFSGWTSEVGKPYGQAKIDAAQWINQQGGVNGKPIALSTVDYAYQVPRAITAYQEMRQRGVVAVQGWGTADTEALVNFVAEDQIPFFSASYSARLTDPTGKGPDTKRPSPYNFIMGPSYSDGVRALLQWAKMDWAGRGKSRKPRYVHMGDNHPYPNAPKKAGEVHAAELGFDVLPAIQYTMAPSDYTLACKALQESGADYVYLANTADSNVPLLKTCQALGVKTQFLSNIWGFDESAMRAAGRAGNGVVFVTGAAPWSANVPGMERVHEIARAADPKVTYQPHHYVRGICAFFFMKEAMDWADGHGGVAGPTIKQGMYQKADWVPAGLEGVCLPATWRPDDHRGFTEVRLYRAEIKSDPSAQADLAKLIADGTISMRPVYDAVIPRKPEWLGW